MCARFQCVKLKDAMTFFTHTIKKKKKNDHSVRKFNFLP